ELVAGVICDAGNERDSGWLETFRWDRFGD
ncbi:MAG: hypothetical protein ACI9IO_001466, partial [Cyanobium sp.]